MQYKIAVVKHFLLNHLYPFKLIHKYYKMKVIQSFKIRPIVVRIMTWVRPNPLEKADAIKHPTHSNLDDC